MDREILAQHLLTATERTRDFATQYVTNELPSSCRCLSSIGLAPVDRMRTDGGPFPAVSHRFHQHIAACLGPHGVDDVLAFLWRAGAVPRWIDTNAFATEGEFTNVGLIFGQFEIDDTRLSCDLHFAASGLSSGALPVQPVGSHLPPNWRDLGPNKQFDLH